tara:strand:- start:795 stop:1091 length:297 start_codon:yes stop_codon:yes gene_type:complete
MKTVQFRTRVEPSLKKKSDSILRALGLDMETFVSMALTQLVNRRGLPFAVTESDEDYFSYEYGLNRNESVGAGNRKRAASKRDKTLGRIKTISGPEDL